MSSTNDFRLRLRFVILMTDTWRVKRCSIIIIIIIIIIIMYCLTGIVCVVKI